MEINVILATLLPMMTTDCAGDRFNDDDGDKMMINDDDDDDIDAAH